MIKIKANPFKENLTFGGNKHKSLLVLPKSSHFYYYHSFVQQASRNVASCIGIISQNAKIFQFSSSLHSDLLLQSLMLQLLLFLELGSEFIMSRIKLHDVIDIQYSYVFENDEIWES